MSDISPADLLRLKNQIVDNFNESHWLELGVLTEMLNDIEGHPRLLRSLRFGDDDHDGLALYFIKKMIDLRPGNRAVIEAYLADKFNDGMIEQSISSEEVLGKKIVFSPNIFTVPDEDVNGNFISVMMPFSSNLQAVYEAIQEAANNSGFECQRADNIWDHSTIIQDIFTLIYKSYIVVCDFTDKNPNVFYEAGIAHALGKHVIPIAQSKNDIPFDLQHHRYLHYLNNGEGLKKLKERLSSRFITLNEKRPDHIKPLSMKYFIPF